MNCRLVLLACLGWSAACGDGASSPLRERAGESPERGGPEIPSPASSSETGSGGREDSTGAGARRLDESAHAAPRVEDELPAAVPCKAEAPQPYPPGNVSSGTYTVPVASALAHAATSAVDEIAFRRDSTGRCNLDYTLPRVLAGCAKHVHLEGETNAEGQCVLYGSAGTATCEQRADGMMTCHEHLTGVEVDLGEVRYALEELGMVGGERADYLAVARRFSIDPLGVLTFRGPR